jgi:hypothetical protein
MRIAGDRMHGRRLRGLVVVLWRAGLRIDEALALREADLDRRRGSLLVRRGKAGRRREVGMDDWGWQELEPWLIARVALPIGPLFCVINGRTRGRPWTTSGARAELRRAAARAGVRRRFAPHQLRHAHAVEMAREGVPLIVIQRQLGHSKPRDHLGLPAGHRQRRDHRNGPRPARADDPRHHLAAELAAGDGVQSGVCTVWQLGLALARGSRSAPTRATVAQVHGTGAATASRLLSTDAGAHCGQAPSPGRKRRPPRVRCGAAGSGSREQIGEGLEATVAAGGLGADRDGQDRRAGPGSLADVQRLGAGCRERAVHRGPVRS